MNHETASRLLLFAWIALGFAAPATGQTTDAHAHVVALLSTFDQALNEMDLDEVMSYYAEDIVILAPGEDAIVGWDAVRSWTEVTFRDFVLIEHHRPVETSESGDLVIHRGNATGSLTPRAGGDPIPFNNKYVHVYRRGMDGRLRMVMGMFNANPG